MYISKKSNTVAQHSPITNAKLINDPTTKNAFKILTLVATGVILVVITVILIANKDFFKTPHFVGVVGFVYSFLLSLFLVLLLQQSEKQITVSGLSFHFSGTSGEIILWAICFLSISHVIAILWALN